MSQQTIYLDKAESQCIARMYPCDRKELCALHLVSAGGRTIADFIKPDGACGMFKPASAYRVKFVDPTPAREYVKGLL